MRIEVYCDESRPELAAAGADVGASERVLIGGIWVEAGERRFLKRAIREHCAKYRVGGEFKWNRVSPSRHEFYTGLIDLFFASSARFRCLVLPAAILDAHRFHDGDHELMFWKFYYQLLHNWIYPGNSYRVFLDGKTARLRSRVRDLHEVLGRANEGSELPSVQHVDSRQVQLLQLADVLIGAVGYRFMPGTSPAKLAVVGKVEKHIGRRIGPTTRDVSKFNVFCWEPGEW